MTAATSWRWPPTVNLVSPRRRLPAAEALARLILSQRPYFGTLRVALYPLPTAPLVRAHCQPMQPPRLATRRFRHPVLELLGVTAMLGWALGCGPHHGLPTDAPGGQPILFENPLFVGVTERDMLWTQIVDAVNSYFDIEREERVKLAGEMLTEGRIETVPRAAATMFEPWQLDATTGFDAWQATLQSIRRRALVRVVPANGGYRVEVVVQKELEDVDRPEYGTAGGVTMRHDGSITRDPERVENGPVTLGWIPLGRDIALEQRILSDIQARLRISAAAGADLSFPSGPFVTAP